MNKFTLVLTILSFCCGGMTGYTMAYGRIFKQLKEQRASAQQPEEQLIPSPPLANPTPQSPQPFSTVVQRGSDKKVLSLDSVCEPVLDAIATAAQTTLTEMNTTTSPVRGLPRINEASRYFENRLQELLDQQPDLSCTIPLTVDGKAQRAGYPDLLITHHPTRRHYYLDPKLYETQSRDSSLRTFYYSPRSQSSKIQKNAHHLLLGFGHNGKDGEWTFESWTLLDLSQVSLTLKSEYNASNKELYQPQNQVRQSP